MIELGRYNRLTVDRNVDFGAYLTDGEGNVVLLPARYIERPLSRGDELEVFVYNDSEDRPVATTETPFVKVGEFAFLQVTDVNKAGAFLDWGLPKDLLCPFREQKITMMAGGEYLVYAFVDHATGRIVASAKIEKFLDNVYPAYRPGDEVTALFYRHTDIGYKAIVDNLHSGMAYENELYTPVELGQETRAWIKRIRPDGKLDLTLTAPLSDRITDLGRRILDYLDSQGGSAPIGDKTSPETIRELFGCSKKDFKRAAGALYRDRAVRITPEGMERVG